MIKAVIFDMGGVILNLDKMKEELVKIFNPKDFDKFWDKVSVIESPLCRGEIDDEEYWKRLSKEFKVDISLKEVRYFWIDNFKDYCEVDRKMLKLIKKLKKNYKIGLISNATDTHDEAVRKMNILGDFDDIIFSNEVNMAKDNTKIFDLCLDRLQLDAGECVFIDDVEEFVRNARKVGMEGVVFEGVEELKGELKKLEVVF